MIVLVEYAQHCTNSHAYTVFWGDKHERIKSQVGSSVPIPLQNHGLGAHLLAPWLSVRAGCASFPDRCFLFLESQHYGFFVFSHPDLFLFQINTNNHFHKLFSATDGMPPRVGTCVPMNEYGCAAVGFVSGVCLAHGHGINLEVIFTTGIGEWTTSFFSVAKCICKAYLTKQFWNTSPSKHGNFLFASSSSCHANGPRISTLTTPGHTNQRQLGNIIFSNFLLHPLHHSPQLLQLSTSFLLSIKGVDSYLSFLQINLFTGIQYHFPVFCIHLSYQWVTQWIIFTWGGFYRELKSSPWTSLLEEGEALRHTGVFSLAGLLLAQEGLCLLEMFALKMLSPQVCGRFFK